MNIPTSPKETPKVKELTIDQKILMRLVTLKEQGKNTGQLAVIAKQCGCTFIEAMNFVVAFARAQVIVVEPIDANEFHFKFLTEPEPTLKSAAHNFNTHLCVSAEHQQKTHGPEAEAMSAALLPEAMELSRRLGEDIAYKLTRCAIKVGMPAVREMVAASVENKQPVGHFFHLYRQKKKELKNARNSDPQKPG